MPNCTHSIIYVHVRKVIFLGHILNLRPQAALCEYKAKSTYDEHTFVRVKIGARVWVCVPVLPGDHVANAKSFLDARKHLVPQHHKRRPVRVVHDSEWIDQIITSVDRDLHLRACE